VYKDDIDLILGDEYGEDLQEIWFRMGIAVSIVLSRRLVQIANIIPGNSCHECHRLFLEHHIPCEGV
jgi:hypothetical protein